MNAHQIRRALVAATLLLPLLTVTAPARGTNYAPMSGVVVCPSVTDGVTFSSYGTYIFGHVGDDSVARQIIAQCGWHVFAGHNGGFGDTLQIAPPSEAIILTWAWNNFEKVTLRAGWTGATDRGVRLGDSEATVTMLYPEIPVSQVIAAEYESADGCVGLIPVFDRPGGLLVELTVWSPMQYYEGAPAIDTCDLQRASPATASVVEYYYAATDEYFITSIPAEISALDSNRFPGWVRTGLGFGAYAAATIGASPVCRLFIPPASHFYSASPAECALTQQRFRNFVYESPSVFYIDLPNTATGACPGGTIAIYRLFDNRADPNHRYTTSTAVVDQMHGRGWIPEGYGPGPYFPIMCSPSSKNTLFLDTFSVMGNHLDFNRWTTEIGPTSYLGRTQLADWVTPGSVGTFVVGASGAQLSLSTFNPTGFSLYGTHGKTLASFQPTANTTLSYTARLQLTSLQPGLVYGAYLYGCPGPCETQHDEIDIELVTNLLQPGASPLQVQVNTYANEPLGAGNGALINLPAGFDPLAAHDWTIRWSLNRVDYLVDGTLLTSTNTHVPQGPLQANVIAWGPAVDWSAAYSDSLKPVSRADQNQTFTALLRSVSVTSSSSNLANE